MNRMESFKIDAKHMGRKNSNIVIDENNQVTAPGFFQRLRNACLAIIMGIVFAQVILFAFRKGSIVIWWDNIIFIAFLMVCATLGWIVGGKFIETLGGKSGNLWDDIDIWGFFR